VGFECQAVLYLKHNAMPLKHLQTETETIAMYPGSCLFPVVLASSSAKNG
jgi:hypothetical protein